MFTLKLFSELLSPSLPSLVMLWVKSAHTQLGIHYAAQAGHDSWSPLSASQGLRFCSAPLWLSAWWIPSTAPPETHGFPPMSCWEGPTAMASRKVGISILYNWQKSFIQSITDDVICMAYDSWQEFWSSQMKSETDLWWRDWRDKRLANSVNVNWQRKENQRKKNIVRGWIVWRVSHRGDRGLCFQNHPTPKALFAPPCFLASVNHVS